MAQQSIDPIHIPMVYGIGSRDGTLTKDERMVNCSPEKVVNGMAAMAKRPGLSLERSLAGSTPQGQFSVNFQPFSIVNDTVVNLSNGATTDIPSITVPLQQFYCLSDVPTGTTMLKSASGLWRYDGTTMTKVTDANYPAATVPGIAYLDGVYYVMNTVGEVLGSGLEDPMTWPALDFIQADFTLGTGAGICRHLNYIMAFYTKGLQTYWDADAAPTGQGTALGPVQNASWTTGTSNGRSIQEMDDITFFIAQDSKLGTTVQMLEGLAMAKISDTYVEKVLARSPPSNIDSFALKVGGHSYYGITITDLQLTLVFDIGAGLWTQWSSFVNGVETEFVGMNYLNGASLNLFQDRSSGNTLQMTSSALTDVSGAIQCYVITPNFDGGNMNWKRFTAQFFMADTVNATVFVSHSDDDYQTWSTPRSVNMSTVRKMLQRCGRSRRRAWKFYHTDATTLRMIQMSIDLAPATA